MTRIQYPRYINGIGKEKPFTADEIKRGVHTLWIDLVCQHCKYTIALSSFMGNEDKCPKCGR